MLWKEGRTYLYKKQSIRIWEAWGLGLDHWAWSFGIRSQILFLTNRLLASRVSEIQSDKKLVQNSILRKEKDKEREPHDALVRYLPLSAFYLPFSAFAERKSKNVLHWHHLTRMWLLSVQFKLSLETPSICSLFPALPCGYRRDKQDSRTLKCTSKGVDQPLLLVSLASLERSSLWVSTSISKTVLWQMALQDKLNLEEKGKDDYVECIFCW